MIKPCLVLLVLVLCTAPTTPPPFSYTINDGTATIDGYSGDGGDVTIPNILGGLPVTGIGDGVFSNLTSLTGVKIPAGISNIGNDAFDGCSNLTSIVIPNSDTNIGAYAFEDCTSLTNALIGNGVISIDEFAFQGCTNLTNVYFKGNAPLTVDSTVFHSDTNATVYYLPGAAGWGDFSTNAGVPTLLWNPLIQTGGGSFGISNHQFGFNITGTSNIPVAVEACTDLASPNWTLLQTLRLSNGLFYFSEPLQTNNLGRFYRINSP